MGHSLRNRQIKAFFIFFLFLLCFPSLGEEKTFPAQAIKSIVVKTVHLDLKVTKKNSEAWAIKWVGDLSFQLNEGLLTVESNNFNSRKTWRSKSSKTVILEISGPSVPVKVFSFSSKNSFASWTEPVFVSGFKGSVTGLKNKGLWELSLREGTVDISGHQGSLSVKGFRVNFNLSMSRGDFQFHINEGQLTVGKSEGKLNFTTNRAGVKLTQFRGSLKGYSQLGEITASINPETVDLFAGEGSIRVNCMGQAPKVRAYTEKGKIYGPRYLYKKFSGKSVELSGRIRGASKKGTVSLRSDTANIYIN